MKRREFITRSARSRIVGMRLARTAPAIAMVALASGLCFPRLAAAQSTAAPPAPPPPPPAATEHQMGDREAPTLRISGFGDINYSYTKKVEGPRGFSLGQFALHLASELSSRVTVRRTGHSSIR